MGPASNQRGHQPVEHESALAGADAARVRRLVLEYAGAITVAGVFLGLAGAWAASRWVATILFDTVQTLSVE